MAQTTVEATTNGQATKKPLAPPDEQFWVRYSPHHEAPLSGVSSLTLHILVPALIALYFVFFHKYFEKQNQPIPVTGIALGDNLNAGGGGAPNGAGTERPEEAVAALAPTEQPPVTPQAAQPPELTVPKETTPLPRPDESIRPVPDISDAQKNVESLQSMNASINNTLKQAISRASKGQGGTGTGGGAGNGTGTGVGDGSGAGKQGSMASDREKRILRWSLRFSTRDGGDYLHQLAGLGAILAVPEPDGTFRVLRDLKQMPPKGNIEDINSINRIFWIDNQPDSVGSLARALRLNPPPPYIVSFFPESLEKKLLDLELRHANKKEHQIKETRFLVERKGNIYVPRVVAQE